MRVLTAAQMGLVDRRTVEAGIPMGELMERAGEAAARFCLGQYPEAERVMVLCGKGNNGGDGFVTARLLAAEGIGVRVLLAGRKEEVQGDAGAALRRLLDETSEEILEELVEGDVDAAELVELLSEAELLVDAVVGTGFRPPLRGVPAVLRDAVNGLKVPVLAIDLPSGWDADSMVERFEGAFRADAVVTFTAPKVAHVLGHLTTGVSGPMVVAEIGTAKEIVDGVAEDAPETEIRGLRWTGTSKALAEVPRAIDANKGKFGHVLVVGGSNGTAGAPSMAAVAALRTGAGLVTAAVPHSVENTVAQAAMELMVRGLVEVDGAAATANLEEGRLRELLRGIKVIALGPGLSTRGEAGEFARGLVALTTLPIVIDADGLNAFAGRTALLKAASGDGAERRTIVLTPHPGEMARLLGLTVAEVEKDRVAIARRFATEHQLTLVLKGWRTLVAHPDGRVAVNTTGNPAMAKGGSGDILTGVVAGCLAQWPGEVARAVETAVYVHGLAGDFAARKQDEKTVLAMDTVAHLSDAYRFRADDGSGAVWMCGLRGAP